MAVVPFRQAGPAADPHVEQRLLQIGPYCITVRQRPAESGGARHLREGPRVEWPQEDEEDKAAAAEGRGPDLGNVGLVVWNSGFLLADLLLRRPPMGAWPGVRVLELGCGTGVCGMFLAAAGARVLLSDLPHITPLARENVAANCGGGGAAGAPLVVDYAWGEPAATLRERAVAAAAASGQLQQWQQQQQWRQHEDPFEFDLIIGSDLLYEPSAHGPLLQSLSQLAARHTQVHLCYRRRGLGEEGFSVAASDAGWAVAEVPQRLLHEEFQEGDYRAMVLCQI